MLQPRYHERTRLDPTSCITRLDKRIEELIHGLKNYQKKVLLAAHSGCVFSRVSLLSSSFGVGTSRNVPPARKGRLRMHTRSTSNWVNCMLCCEGFILNGVEPTLFRRSSKGVPTLSFMNFTRLGLNGSNTTKHNHARRFRLCTFLSRMYPPPHKTHLETATRSSSSRTRTISAIPSIIT